MQTTFIFSLMGENIVRALFWTLAHSLWQGLALALLTGLVILCTRRSAPVLRYNIFMGLFCLFLVTTGGTFFRQMRETGVAGVRGEVMQVVQMPVRTPVMNNVYATGDQSRMTILIRYLNDKANIVVAIWAVILFIRLVKLAVHLGTIQRLRYYRASRADELWQERVRGLAERIGIRRGVELLESSIVRIPMMVGMLKPVILVPLGLLAQLPPQQMEGILLHELAHIRRKDYIINILQSFAEILFFFNPAVLWINSLIREERENCCDDIAIGETSSKKEFIHALVSFQEYAPSGGYALAFPGNKHHLLYRVKRIIHHDNKILNMREKIYLLVCIFITAGLTMAYTKLEQPQVRSERAVVKKDKIAITDTTVFMQDTLPQRTGKRKAGGDTTLSPKDREAVLVERERRLEEAERRLDEQAAELDAKQQQLNDLYTEQMARLQGLREHLHDGEQGSKWQLDTLVLRDQLERELVEKNQALEQSLYSLEKMKQEQFERHYDNNNLQYKREMEQRQRQIGKLFREQRFQLNNKLADLLKVQNDLQIDQRAAERKGAEGIKNSIAPVINMLAERKLVDTSGNFSFSLDKAGLVVNGKKQPDEVFLVFKEEFLGSPEDYYRHSKKGSSESSSVNQHRR